MFKGCYRYDVVHFIDEGGCGKERVFCLNFTKSILREDNLEFPLKVFLLSIYLVMEGVNRIVRKKWMH